MLLLAHRGLPGPSVVENSARAVADALAGGADGCEVDLRLTADGVLVAAHDEELGRYGAPGARVSACAAADLPLARLSDLLDAADGAPLVLELKATLDVSGTLRALGAALPAAADVVVSSFDARLAAGARSLGVPTALLGAPGTQPRRLLAAARAAGHAQVHPHVSDLLGDPGLVPLAARHGLAVVPWTVNRPGDVVPGCAAVISDDCAALVPALAA